MRSPFPSLGPGLVDDLGDLYKGNGRWNAVRLNNPLAQLLGKEGLGCLRRVPRSCTELIRAYPEQQTMPVGQVPAMGKVLKGDVVPVSQTPPAVVQEGNGAGLPAVA